MYICRRCKKNGRPFANRIDYVASKYGDCYWDPTRPQTHIYEDIPCPTCGFERDANIINGRFVADQKCGGKCVNATGPSCSCQCGGENHGAHYTFHFESTEKAS